MIDSKILLFVGPSGSGKTTCLKALTGTMPDTFEYIPSLTTRPPRPDEDAWTYTFVSEELFDLHERANDLLQQTSYNGYRYGTLRRDFQNAIQDNHIPTLAVTEDGVQQFIDNGFYPIVIHLAPYNFTPRDGRSIADSTRPSLPSKGYSLSHITFDWSQSPHKRMAAMLRNLYGLIEGIL